MINNSLETAMPVFAGDVARGFVLGAKAVLPPHHRFTVMVMFLVHQWPESEQETARAELELAHAELGYKKEREVYEPKDHKDLALGFLLGFLTKRPTEEIALSEVVEKSHQHVRLADQESAMVSACRRLSDRQVLSITNWSRPPLEWRFRSLLCFGQF